MIVAFPGDKRLLFYLNVCSSLHSTTLKYIVAMRIDYFSISYDLFLNVFDLRLSIVLTFSIAAYPVWYWHIRWWEIKRLPSVNMFVLQARGL